MIVLLASIWRRIGAGPLGHYVGSVAREIQGLLYDSL